jgi:hypothetical protein
MSLWGTALIIVGASAVAVGLLLLIRHWSPHGGHFGDTGRAVGVFSILATTYAVLFAFIVLLAFTAYDNTRSGAETEANTVNQQFETAQLLPAAPGARMSAQLVCYARSVIHQEWPQMTDGHAPAINAWAVPLFVTTKSVNPATPAQQSAYSEWLTQTSQRELARQARIHGSTGIIPAPLWFVFLISAAIVFGFVFFFADRGEGMVVQAVQVGAVTAMLAASILVVRFLDQPYRPGTGSIRPVAMQETLDRLDLATRALHLSLPAVCDATGRPIPTGAGG